MKKLFGLFLISFTCAFAGALTACKDKTEDNRPTCTVTFTAGEGFTYELVTGEESTEEETKKEELVSVDVKQGDTLSFRLDVGAFYAGTPTVLVGDTAVSSVDDVYSFTVNSSATVKVDGIVKDVSNMIGTGASDNAFLVTRPIDLIYIAEQVNAGNETYSTASYVLGADIDCKGEELKIIGDMSTETSFFSGVFACYTDSSTNELSRYTISNFTINSDSSQYVGLFGCVQTNLTTQSSGLFYGIRLENFTINAGTANAKTSQPVIYAGSLIGYGVGATMYLCDAVNGDLNVFADDNYFAFAGGLIGCQQAFYAQEYNLPTPSEIAYSTVDVDVTSVKGATLYAGGVSGYTFTNSLVAPVFIHNVASHGSVSGAINAGGIVGGLGQYSSVATAYSTGDVIAYSDNTISLNNPFMTDDTYCHSFAGGLVGYAENDTIVNDSFSIGETLATGEMGASYTHAGTFVGGGDNQGKIGVNAQKYVELCNLSQVNISDESFGDFKTKLGWREADWTFTAGEYPAINYETTTETITTTLTIHYVTKAQGVTIKVNNATSMQYSYKDGYETIMTAFNNGSIPLYQQADNTGYRSYGYYFDQACTKPVPYAYLSTRDVNLYVGFANYTPVVGTYYVGDNDETIKLTLNADGYASYTDGTANIKVPYQFDGETLLIEGATFARFYTGAVDPELSVNEDANFDMNRYNAYYFEGVQTSDGLALYDGAYFTKDSPLLATVTGTEEMPDEHGFSGSWYDPVLNVTLAFSGQRTATLTYGDGTVYELVCEKAKKSGYYMLYYVYEQNGSDYKTAFGYFKPDTQNRTLVSVITDHTSLTTGYSDFSLYQLDVYKGDWVTNGAIAEGTITFNGGGYFAGAYSGWLEINGEKVPYEVDPENNNEGTFALNGVTYIITFNSDTVTITSAETNVTETFKEVDDLAKHGGVFVEFDETTFAQGDVYTFNGKGNVGAGEYTVNEETTKQSYALSDFEEQNGYYEWNGKKLYPVNSLMGKWAMGGEFEALEIGPSNLNGDIYARFKGKTVKIKELSPEVWTFSTKLENMPVTYYLFLLYGEKETNGATERYLSGFALTQYTSLAYNQYTICSPADELFGTWEMTENFEGENKVYRTLSFDGVSFDPTGRYSFGTANMSYMGSPTPYNYIKTANGKILLWSQTPLLGYTRYYTLVECETTTAGAYVKDGKAFTLKEVDAVMDTVAKDKSGTLYTFDGGNVNGKEGELKTNTGKTYAYKLTAYDSQTTTWTIALTDKATKKEYVAKMFTGNPENVTITIMAK